MDSSKNITDMFTRFIEFINDLKSLGKDYNNSEFVRKILRSLPKTQKAKVTMIQEAKDLNKLSLKEFIGSLMAHELNMMQNVEDEAKKRRYIALKSMFKEDEESNTSKD